MDINEAIRIHGENIEEFSRRQAVAEKQRENSVSELLALIVGSSEFSDAEDVYESFRNTMRSCSYLDRARLSHILGSSQKYGARMWEKAFFGEEVAAGSHGKVALVRNKYNELAFSRFSKVITRPKEVFVSSFTSACEDVYDSRSEFCILPVENAQNGRLFGFYSMLDRYELKICAVCEPDIEHVEGSVRYALVGKAVPDRIPKGAEWCFEFSVISGSGGTLSDIASVADIFSARLSKVDSLPVEYDSGLQKYYFTFDLPEDSISAFDLFLSEEYAGYTSVGLYPRV